MGAARARRGGRSGGSRGGGGIALRGVVSAVVLTLGVGSGVAAGQPVPLTGELPVNQTVTGDQEFPEVGMRANGTHVVVWRGDVAGGTSDLFLRRFPGDGTAPFNESTLNQNTAGNQFDPAIDMNSTGDWIAVWTTSQAGHGLRARATSSGGSILGSEFNFSEATSGSFNAPHVSRAEDGTSVAAWLSAGPKFRRFDAAGTAVTGELPAGVGLTNSLDPRAATVANGAFWIALVALDAHDFGVYRERYDALGTPVDTPELVAESEDNTQLAADIEAAADDGFVVSWADLTLGIRARCFAADGSPRSGEVAVAPDIFDPRVAVAPDGAFVVVWRTAASEIGAREYDRTCRPVGTAFTVNTVTAGTQVLADVASSNDRYVVVWQGPAAGGDTNGTGVARRLFLRRSIFADDLESADDSAWSAVSPP